MPFLAVQFLTLVVLGTLVVCAGAPLVRDLGGDGLRERLAWSIALGLLLWAEACFLAGLAHALRAPIVVTLALGALALGGKEAWRLTRDLLAWCRASRARPWFVALALLFAAPIVVSALYPPFHWDETIYHLVFARSFAESGSLPYLIAARVPVFPPFAEALSAAVLLLADDVATHWVAIVATVGTVLLLLAWRDVPRSVRLLAAALFLGSPLVVFLAGLGYVDPLLTLWVTAAVAALDRARRGGARRWLAVAGASAGAAASVKYLGLFVVGWIALESLCTWRGPLRARLAATSTVVASSLAVAGPVYARIVAWTGSPLFPFYPAVFGASPWAYEVQPSVTTTPVERILSSLAVVWRGVFDRGAVGEMPPFSPFWPFVVLVLVVGAFRVPRWRWALAMLVAYLLVIPTNARYVLPLVPYAGLAGLAALGGWVARRVSAPRALAAAVIVLAAPGWLYALYVCEQRGPVPSDPRARDRFLAERLDCYSSVAFLNRAVPGDYAAYGLPLERLAGLAHGRWFGDVTGPWSFGGATAQIERDGTQAPMLREAGAEYLVMEEPLAQRLRRSLESSGGRVLFRDGSCSVFALHPR